MRPLIFGYLLVPAEAPGAVGMWHTEIVGFADREGYALGEVFQDVTGGSGAGLDALGQALSRGEGAAVVVPDPAHLAALSNGGCGTTVLRVAGRRLHTRILALHPAPDGSPRVPGTPANRPHPLGVQRASHSSRAAASQGARRPAEHHRRRPT